MAQLSKDLIKKSFPECRLSKDGEESQFHSRHQKILQGQKPQNMGEGEIKESGEESD